MMMAKERPNPAWTRVRTDFKQRADAVKKSSGFR
jgi:hypothetical protein